MAVNNVGHWTPETDYTLYPADKWCDCDKLANWIMQTGYQIETTLENLVLMILAHFMGETEDEDSDFYMDDGTFHLHECIEYIEASGGLEMFDYIC